MAIKKLFSFHHAEVVKRLSEQPNQSAFAEQAVAEKLGIALKEKPEVHIKEEDEVLSEEGYPMYPAGTKICAKCGRRLLNGLCPYHDV